MKEDSSDYFTKVKNDRIMYATISGLDIDESIIVLFITKKLVEMLLTDETALEKANAILKESGLNTSIPRWLWVEAEEEKDDILCYYVLIENEEFEYPLGTLLPLFKRNGEMTDF